MVQASCIKITVSDDAGLNKTVNLYGGGNVENVLAKAKIELSPSDTISSPLNEIVQNGETIEINRNGLKEIPTNAVISMSEKIFSANLAKYEENKAKEAAALLAQQRQSTFSYSGEVPLTAVFNADGTITTSSGTYTIVGEITMEASAYCPCTICCGEYASGYTADGSKATAGYTVATSSDYAFGTLFFIPYFDRVFEVEDRGGAIVDNRIDIYFDTHEEALQFGRKTITVFIIE